MTNVVFETRAGPPVSLVGSGIYELESAPDSLKQTMNLDLVVTGRVVRRYRELLRNLDFMPGLDDNIGTIARMEAADIWFSLAHDAFSETRGSRITEVTFLPREVS